MAKNASPDTASPADAAEATAVPQQLVYVGPNLIDPVPLSHRSAYVGGIPAFAQGLAEKDTDLAGCFVPLSEAGKAIRELEGYPGTSPGEYTRRYQSVQKRYRKEGK